MRVGKPILRALYSNAAEARVEREKKAYKDKMWSKVNSWLTDFDHKLKEELPYHQDNQFEAQKKEETLLKEGKPFTFGMFDVSKLKVDEEEDEEDKENSCRFSQYMNNT